MECENKISVSADEALVGAGEMVREEGSDVVVAGLQVPVAVLCVLDLRLVLEDVGEDKDRGPLLLRLLPSRPHEAESFQVGEVVGLDVGEPVGCELGAGLL